jgi:hypothetical protein
MWPQAKIACGVLFDWNFLGNVRLRFYRKSDTLLKNKGSDCVEVLVIDGRAAEWGKPDRAAAASGYPQVHM